MSGPHTHMRPNEMFEDDDVHKVMRLVVSAMHIATYNTFTGKVDIILFAAGRSRAADYNVKALC